MPPKTLINNNVALHKQRFCSKCRTAGKQEKEELAVVPRRAKQEIL
jgi:hypothetical protein